MNSRPLFVEFRARFQAKTKTRILAFSNTDRYYPGMYWLDVLDLALQNTYGRIHHCINTSVGGQTTADMLERFDEDAAFYRPQLVFITIGGGEGHPGSRVTPDGFAGNLRELHRRFAALGCAVVFQTYYALDPDRVEPERLKRIYANMDIVRAAAAATGAALIDHLALWEPFRRAHPDLYRELMQDGLHVNANGNIVMGLYVATQFDADVRTDPTGFWDKQQGIIRLMREAKSQ